MTDATKRRTGGHAVPDIDLATLDTRPLAELRDLWHRIGGRGQPAHRRILIREIAHLIQSRCTGGMDAATERLLAAAMRAAFKDRPPAAAPPPRRRQRADDAPRTPKPATKPQPTPAPRLPRTPSALPDGARLVRIWRGRTYEVTVAEGGKAFIYSGTTYRSLSKVAEAITGTVWSGPLFFGLTQQTRSKGATR